MKKLSLSMKGQSLHALLATALGALCVQLYLANLPTEASTSQMVLRAEQGRSDMSLRNPDFPSTFISAIHVDVTSPNHWVRLTWTGPQAADQEKGPFRSSPGGGQDGNDCNDVAESNRAGSRCTPKGSRRVEAFSDYMPSVPVCEFVTWFHSSREIAFHSFPTVADYPASSGCVRLSRHAAQLIHNNCLVGRTEVTVDGAWTRPE